MRETRSRSDSTAIVTIAARFPEDGDFEQRMQAAELDYVASSKAMQMAIAENYAGLPL